MYTRNISLIHESIDLNQPSQSAKSLDRAKASTGRETSNARVSSSRSNILSAEVDQKIGGAA
jgi:hypothetical protein